MNRDYSSQQGVSLVELLLAMSLLTLIALAAISSEMLGERVFSETSDLSLAQQEAGYLSAHLFQSLFGANLVRNEGGSNEYLLLRVDMDLSGAPLDTPGDPSDDTYFRYTYDSGQDEVLFLHTSTDVTLGGEVIAEGITSLTWDVSPTPSVVLPLQIQATRGTQSVTLETAVAIRSMSSG